jgi:adenylosuccinate synthase
MRKAVIGLGFGDEGKGMFTDYLCSQLPDAMVVRFSGGHQAGHTVEYKNKRHVFANFGSGSLRGNPTYWSKHCTVEPLGLFNELDILNRRGVLPTLYIDAECPITTPYDIQANQLSLTYKRNGTCGVGFGNTINREQKFYHLQFMDLFNPSILKAKLKAVSDFYMAGITYDREREFLNACARLVNTENIILAYGNPGSEHEPMVFEGSQGLLLDQHYGFYPNVTWSNTGTKNLPKGDYEYYLITRAYQTRHGNGYMSNEIDDGIRVDHLESNVSNPYQGDFRRGILDLDLLVYAIDKDKELRKLSANRTLVITCLDHLKRFHKDNRIVNYATLTEFVDAIINNFRCHGLEFTNTYTSRRTIRGIEVS